MNDKEEIKAQLQARLIELTDRAEEIDDDLGELGDDDSQEQAAESSGDEVLEGVGHITVGEIRQIKLALASIDAGNYGTCSSCGGSIAEGRLRAMPHATRCVKCS